MEKKELKSKIDETINLIKTNSKDARFAENLIDKLMSLKGQYDVEPMLVSMPLIGNEEIINSGGAYTITRNNHGVVFHVRGLDFVQRKDGADVVIKNYNKFAHCPYDRLFDLWNKKKEEPLSEDEEKDYEALLMASVALPQVPFVASTNEEWQATLVLLLTNWFEELTDRLNAELQPETPEEDAAFENKLKIAEEVFKEGQDDVKSL